MKRLCESDGDRISHLPDDVIQRILALLPVKEAAKTATLSKQWRRNWRANTQLVFDDDFGRISKEGNYDLNASKLMSEIFKALLVHDGPITHFELAIPGLRRPSPDINHLVHVLSKKGLQELSLIFSRDEINVGQPRQMPSALFSACQLNSLKLRHCDFLRAPSWFLGFSKLTHLELTRVNVDSSFYSEFVPNCRLLHSLKLYIHIRDPAAMQSHLKAELVAPSLKVFQSNVWNICFKHTPLLSEVSIVPMDGDLQVSVFHGYNPNFVAVFASLPAIQELTVGFQFMQFLASGDVPVMLPSHLHQLKVLELCGILYRLLEARILVSLIMSSPNLQKLIVWFIDDDTLPPTEVIDSLQLLLEAEDYSTASCFQFLEEFEMKTCQGTQVELDLVRFVLGTAPLLRRIFIEPGDNLDSRKGHKFLKEVTRCKRASKEAEVIYVSNDEADTL